MKHFEIQPRLFLYIFLSFILCTVIGALSHECGHIAVAESLGYKTRLSYASMHYNTKAERMAIWKIAKPNIDKIKNKQPFPEQALFESKWKKRQLNSFMISLGGPLQTIITGTIGFLILLYRRKRYPLLFNIWNWIAVFLAFFWVRQPCNLAIGLVERLLERRGSWFGGDERKMSSYLEIPSGTLSIITGIIGFLIIAYAILVIIPKKYRVTFIASGITGSFVGFLLWMVYLGPYLLP